MLRELRASGDLRAGDGGEKNRARKNEDALPEGPDHV
jgi:hypothetical protein